MSPLAQLLQIKPAAEVKREDKRSLLGKIWAQFVGLLRSAKVQRRVRRIEIVERITLGNKQSVVLLRLDQREFMVGCCGDSVVMLAPPHATVVPEKAIPEKTVKTSTKRRARAKSAKPKKVAQPVLAPIEPAASAATTMSSSAMSSRRLAEKQADGSTNIELTVKPRVPTKARLVKAFGGRAQ